MPVLRAASLTALMLLGGCAYGYADTYAPAYPPGYDAGMGGGQFAQPGDLFGGQNVASIDVFYQALAPYGRWVDSRFGRGFQPRTAAGWRPYVNGRWGENRLWISEDPWGWATDHYGRWGHDDRLGWVWIPGTQWAPSWVAWRDADQVSGWAPIPPGVNYTVGLGFGTGGFGNNWGFDNWNSWYGPGWVWVPRASLYRPGFGGAILPWSYGINYWNGSRWNHGPGWNNNWNGGWNNGWNNGWNGGWNNGWNNGRNGGRNRRPGLSRPDNRPVTAPPAYQPGNDRPGYGRPDGGDRSDGGRPAYGRPNGGNWQPRDRNPDRVQRPDAPARYVSAPAPAGGAPAYTPPAGGTPAYAPPPRSERPNYSPPARAERSAPARAVTPSGSTGERFEQPQ